MRKSFLLAFFLILTLASSLEASQTYILSYRAQVKNAVVISESFHLTKSMKDIHAYPAQKLEISASKEINLQKILENNKDKILEFLMKYGTHTRSHETVTDNKSSSLISITIAPTYITVDFKNDYAIITRLIRQ